MQKLGVFWKMGTEIFKIEEEMTEKMKPKVFCILDEFEGSYGRFSTKSHFFGTLCRYLDISTTSSARTPGG